MHSRMTESTKISIDIYIKKLPKIYARNLRRHLRKKKNYVNMYIDK